MKGVGGRGRDGKEERNGLKMFRFLLAITSQIVNLVFISDVFAAVIVAILKAADLKLR
jgi:hypothetical protein